jgi:enolase-phosphatase E1
VGLTVPPDHTRIWALLLDIEGTTTPIDFVYKVLFPYARNHAREFLRQQYPSEAVRADVQELRKERITDAERGLSPPLWRDDSRKFQTESVVAYVHWLMDQDRKSTALKALQGKIWEEGYHSGQLRGQVFADVPPAFHRWRGQNRSIYIFSSGSVLAQKLLFANTTEGDLTPFIQGYFDTTTGAKGEAKSYERIVTATQVPASEILFISDAVPELDAAQLAAVQTALCVRSGKVPPQDCLHPVIHSFEEVLP